MHYHGRQGVVNQGLKGQERMKVQCCVCKRVRKDGRWVRESREDLRAESTSHGYCPRCADKVLQEIRAQGGFLKELRPV